MRDWLALRRPTSNTLSLGQAFAGYVRGSISPTQLNAFDGLHLGAPAPRARIAATWREFALRSGGMIESESVSFEADFDVSSLALRDEFVGVH